MIILGINAYHADASAAIVVDGKLVAAIEEERFRRVKHWAGYPSLAVEYVLREAGAEIDQVDAIAVNRNPSANLLKKALFAVSRRPSFGAIQKRLENVAKLRDIPEVIAEHLKVDREPIAKKFHNVEHHRAHVASSFFVSPFRKAAVLSVDAFGDFVSSMWGVGEDGRIAIHDEVIFPHSLGLFYTAITQFLGFGHYGDEYKVMGLAPYGSPTAMEEMRRIVRLQGEGKFELNLDYFLHHTEGVTMQWDGGSPHVANVFTPALEDLLGPARKPDEPLSDHHKNIAASMQEMYEEAFFNIVNHLQRTTGETTLCLAGGCAYNSVANGKVFEKSKFRELYIQSAAGDAGGAIGAAYWVWNQIEKKPRSFHMDHAYLGPQFTAAEIHAALEAREVMTNPEFRVETLAEGELIRRTAEAIARGEVIGWFQGRSEWGPRALGNRSIVCDPRRADMKDILNLKIKRRESFRPFAPSILRERVGEWFETDYDVPFMLQVYQIREERRAQIPAVTHVNGSGRLQSVTAAQNPRYYRLIEEFGRLTGVPIVLNTSFNENEPVVNTPAEALDCFLRTKMDVLVMGDTITTRI
jgi:carbamoyltransferase